MFKKRRRAFSSGSEAFRGGTALTNGVCTRLKPPSAIQRNAAASQYNATHECGTQPTLLTASVA
eukprot:7183461-Pyramimonas_sp.AAC.1